MGLPEQRQETQCGPDLEVFQVLDVGRLVAVSLAPPQHPEAVHAHGVHEGAAVREQLQGVDLQDAAIVCEPGAQGNKDACMLKDISIRLPVYTVNSPHLCIEHKNVTGKYKTNKDNVKTNTV